ncbi:hypothetical protein D4764_12G0007140 [Takifugu flavidus]|uniref:Uncharacterized protein n=1 Tax=Takifugu flavidus TaxID=433684 RepID=A0A5C6PBZ7_9TELE|nr:hypothetical protein D4764_12G0007140 [Takifugu flavidus]
MVMKELSRKMKLSIYRSIYVPILTYSHQRWVMTERTRSRIQAAEMSFLRRVAGLNLTDRVRSSDIRVELRVEPLLLHIERSHLGWLGHLARMPSRRLPLELFRTCPTGRRPRGRPRTRWRDYISRLAWEQLGDPPGGSGESGRGEGCLGIPPEATQTWINSSERCFIIDWRIKAHMFGDPTIASASSFQATRSDRQDWKFQSTD